MANPTHLYYGARERCITEVGGLTHIYQGKYLVCPVGEGKYDCEGAANLTELKLILQHLQIAYPGILLVNCGR
jgi:hypothetical protein